MKSNQGYLYQSNIREMHQKSLKRLLICTNGAGGGNGGPNSCYHELHTFLKDKVEIWDIPTFPSHVSQNVSNIVRLFYQRQAKENFDEVYLIGNHF